MTYSLLVAVKVGDVTAVLASVGETWRRFATAMPILVRFYGKNARVFYPIFMGNVIGEIAEFVRNQSFPPT